MTVCSRCSKEARKATLSHMTGPIRKVIVQKDGICYLCWSMSGFRWKCGCCGFGLINPFGCKAYQDTKCRRCGAELCETVTGYTWRDAVAYRP